MLIHPQALFHVPLRQGARGQVRALCVPAKTRDRGIIQANAQRMAHVVHCSTVHYDTDCPETGMLMRLATPTAIPAGRSQCQTK